jgi:hypothetical protein
MNIATINGISSGAYYDHDLNKGFALLVEQGANRGISPNQWLMMKLVDKRRFLSGLENGALAEAANAKNEKDRLRYTFVLLLAQSMWELAKEPPPKPKPKPTHYQVAMWQKEQHEHNRS